MKDMDSYFRKWRNEDLDNKSSTFIKGVEGEQRVGSINQLINNSTNQSTQCQSSLANLSFSISFQQFNILFPSFI